MAKQASRQGRANDTDTVHQEATIIICLLYCYNTFNRVNVIFIDKAN